MQKLGFENARHLEEHPSGSEKPYRRQSSANVETTRSPCEEGQKYVEITLDIRDDSVSVYDVKSPEQLKNEAQSFLRPGRFRRSNSILRSIASSFSDELKRVASSVYTRKPPRQRLDRLPRSNTRAELALKGLKFITKTKKNDLPGWPGVEQRFNEITKSSNNHLHRSEFGKCIGMEETGEFALALFDALRRRRNVSRDSINKAELREFWELFNDQDFDSRLQTFFAMVDKDSDGRVNEDEVKEIIALSASANNLKNIRRYADEYASLIMENLDPDNCGYIMIENLETLLLQAPMQAVSESTGENKILSRMLSQKLKVPQTRNLGVRFYRGMKYFLFDNWKRMWVMVLWIGVMAGLFTWKFMQYRKGAAYPVMGACVCLAKGAAETLKLNMAMILLPVCKNTITWLRTKTKLSAIVPVDDNLNFHKVIAIAISVGVGIHATAHLACDFPRLIAADEDKYKPMETYFGPQTKSYMDFVKSMEGVTGIAMVILMTIAFTLATTCLRRNKLKQLPVPLKKITGFNAFWYSHHLFVIVYSLLIVHGYYLYLIKPWYKKTTSMYLMVPVVLYLLERLIRAFRSRVQAVSILKVAVLPGNVLSLHMSRPYNFRYRSGQYMYLKCPKVSSLEWHPFSITSAPGDDYLSVHIKDQGDWTKQLLSVFTEACNPCPTDEDIRNRIDSRHWNSNSNYPRVLIDGPYGAPSQDYKKFQVLLLVGLGIGATPMISIVKNIVNNINGIGEGGSDRRQSPLSPTTTSETFKTTKAYSYWVTREQGSFDWFKKVMDEVTETDHNNVIELHNHCTSVYGEGDARSALIKMLQSLNHEKNGVDVVSGTRVMAHFARPNWRSVFKRIAVKYPNTRVGVFYCGPAGDSVKKLRDLARDFSEKTSTKFCFHKENF